MQAEALRLTRRPAPRSRGQRIRLICTRCRRTPATHDIWARSQFPTAYLASWTNRGPGGSLRAESQTLLLKGGPAHLWCRRVEDRRDPGRALGFRCSGQAAALREAVEYGQPSSLRTDHTCRQKLSEGQEYLVRSEAVSALRTQIRGLLVVVHASTVRAAGPPATNDQT